MQRMARIKAGIARMERINRYKGVNLYVNILDANIDDERLRKEFSEFGIITSAKVITTDGRSKGFGFVSFSFPEEATNALTEMNMQRIASIRMQGVEELNGVDIHGKTLFAGRAQKMTERQAELKDKFERIRMESINRYQGVNLYVNKLDANIDDERLRKEFSEFGIITSAKVMTKDGRSKGFGFVCFSSPEEATNVLTEMNGRIVVAKPLYVALAQRNDNRKAHLASQYMQRIASIKMQTDKMATSNYVLCSICEAQHTIKNSDNWCPECEEGLCSECLKHHNVSKYTKSHEVISIENYQQIPQSVSRIVQHCTEHDRQHQNYCPMHESLCCPQCISEDHTDCVGLLAIENIVKTAKTSAMLDSIDDTLKDMFSNMERMIRDREENLTKITDQRRKIHNEIQEERRKINEHLDKLEEQVIGNLDTEEVKIKSEIENLLENLIKTAVTIAMLQSKLSALKLYGSDLQTFLGGRTILREVEEEEMYVTALLEDKCLQQINLCYRPEAKMAAINNIEIFGSVCKETNPPAINIKRGKDKQAQIMTFTPPVRNVSIHDINLVLLRKKERICNQITGCTITPNGKFIFADYDTKGLNILSEDWTSDNLDTKLPDIQYAFDVTCIDDTRLAISTGKQINILNIASKQIKKIINTSGWCYGITQNEGSLLFCEISRGISRVQLSDNSISLLVKQEAFPNHTYVIASGDNIYHTNNTTNTVSCHKITGDKLWELQDVAIIRNLRGVAVDRDLNVYVASLGNDSVVVISPDGKRCRTVLGKSDGIDRPTAIYFDKLKNKLVVCNYNATAFLYKVE